MTLVLIAAVAHNGAIGNNGDLPWHLPEDLAHLRRVTLGCPVIMGRRTWDSLPARFRPLPGRRNIVLTREARWQAEGAERAGSLDDALALTAGAAEVFVIGGSEVYAAALPRADQLVITEIQRAFDGDTHFPAYRDTFVEVAREPRHAAPPNDFDYAFVTYRRAQRA